MSQCFQDGFTFFIQFLAPALSRSLVENTLQVAFHKPLAGSLHCRHASVQSFGNFAIGFSFVGMQKNSGTIEFSRRTRTEKQNP